MGTFGQEPMADMGTLGTTRRELVVDAARGLRHRLSECLMGAWVRSALAARRLEAGLSRKGGQVLTELG